MALISNASAQSPTVRAQYALDTSNGEIRRVSELHALQSVNTSAGWHVGLILHQRKDSNQSEPEGQYMWLPRLGKFPGACCVEFATLAEALEKYKAHPEKYGRLCLIIHHGDDIADGKAKPLYATE